jgi:hypothetical protein
MSVRAPVSFSIHNENESSFQRSILKQSNSSFVPNSITLGDTASIVKPTLAPKSARKALSTINNNVLNNRALISGSSLTDGKASNASFGKQLTIEKKPLVQVVAAAKVVPTTTVQHSFIIPPDKELVCSGSTALSSWENSPDSFDNSLMQIEKFRWTTAADGERDSYRLEQEEQDRLRAENVMLEELANEMTDLFDNDFVSLDYFP